MRFCLRYFILMTIWAICLPSFSHAHKVSVTFRVDMSQEVISANGVHIAGSFQMAAGYPANFDPASTPMSDLNGDMVFEITVFIPPGTYQYKFVNDNTWNGGENPPSTCTVGTYHDRQVTVGNTDLSLIPVLFNSCNARIIFSVDMANQVISPDGVHVMGTFQTPAGFPANWDPGSAQMQDKNKDCIYYADITVPAGQYEYLYVNGKTISGAETPPIKCATINNAGNAVRIAEIGMETDIMPVYRFDSCEISEPSISTNYKTYWWNDAVFYEIFVRSFFDGVSDDGIGDFRGIINKLDYLNDGDPATASDLGVTAIWLMPLMKSPSYHGYDITDYYVINPDYGSMADFLELVTKAHARGIKIIIDLVLNHTSDQHPWFTQSANNQNGYRDWYIWSETDPGYTGPWGQQVWHWKNNAYYFGFFFSGMPDLNYMNPSVKDEMFNVTNFWMSKEIDGFRLDAVSLLIEDTTIMQLQNTHETLDFLAQFNAVCKSANPGSFCLGEVGDRTAAIIPYVQEQRLDACFEFDLAESLVDAINTGDPTAIQNQLEYMQPSYPILQYGTLLSNHDRDRIFSQFGTDQGKMKQASSLYLTLPGIPFIYYGEEVGLIGTGEDENNRRPMQWTPGLNAGFSSHIPWEDVGNNYPTNNVETMTQDQGSLLTHYKRLIRLRNDHEVLRRGYHLNVNSADTNILSYARIYDGNAIIVMSNFGSSSSNPLISLPISSLPAGNYYVTEIYTGHAMGTLTINSNGGFSGWQNNDNTLDSRETSILLLSSNPPGAVSESPDYDLGFILYPNPAIHQVRVILSWPFQEDASAEVYTASGNCILKQTFSGDQTSISTSGLPAGIYFVKISTRDKARISPLVVVK